MTPHRLPSTVRPARTCNESNEETQKVDGGVGSSSMTSCISGESVAECALLPSLLL